MTFVLYRFRLFVTLRLNISERTMAKVILDFEKPIAELEKKIEDMKDYSVASKVDLKDDINRLKKES